MPGNPSPDIVGGGAASGSLNGPLQLIAFGLGNEWYALEVSQVRGIEPETDITPVPKAPAWLVGVFNLHGAIVPAIDPSSLLGVPRRERKGSGLLVVFLWEGHQAALLVDAVDEMYELSRTSLEPQLPTVEADRVEFIQGQVRVRDRLIGVINLRALVSALLEG